MTALTDLSDVVNRLTGGNSGTPESLWFHKVARDNGAAIVAIPVAGRPYSLWSYDGSPGQGVAPTTWVNPDNTTNGGLLQTDPGGGREKWLTQFFATGIFAGTLILYDRLGHNGNLSGTVTTAQTFTGTLTRYTNGVGNIAWYEIYGNTTTILGATGTTCTMEYTNQAGTASRVTPAIVIGGTGFREGKQARFFPLQSGDTGIQSVQNVDLLASTGTAGAFGVTVAHVIASSVVNATGAGGWRDFITGLPGIPEIQTDACLGLLWLANGAAAPEVLGCAAMIEA